MARWYYRRRKRPSAKTLSGKTRVLFLGLLQLGVAGILIAAAGFLGSVVGNQLTFTLTSGTTTLDIDLGFIISIVPAAAGIFVMFSALRKIGWIRI